LKYEYKTTSQKLISMSEGAFGVPSQRQYVPLPMSLPDGEGPWRIIHVHVFDHFDGPRATIIWERSWAEPTYSSKCTVCGETNVIDADHQHRGHPLSVYAEDGTPRSEIVARRLP
jgi:hypothetical protein